MMSSTQLTLLPPEQEKLTPFLRYCGGKTLLAPRLAAIYEPYRNTHIWVEPFCGALGATLGVMPKHALLSDINPHLINLYREIELGLKSPSGWENSKERFKQIKTDFNRSLDLESGFEAGSWWRAKAFYYLNRTCFNGVCRFNLKGEFNVGYGKFKEPKLDHDFSLYQPLFKRWGLFNFGYKDTINISNNYALPRFFYADPPYDAGFVKYSGDFTWNDQVQLAESLAKLNCPVVASNKATDRIMTLYESLGFNLEIISVRRRVSCNGDRSPVNEILATKNI
jgi:DNA adenine methylase